MGRTVKENMDTQGGRLRHAFILLINVGTAKNFVEISNRLGYKQTTTLSHILSSEKPLPKQLVEKLSINYPQVNIEWVQNGGIGLPVSFTLKRDKTYSKMLQSINEEGENVALLSEPTLWDLTETINKKRKNVGGRLKRFFLSENLSLKDAMGELSWTRRQMERIINTGEINEDEIKELEMSFPFLNTEWVRNGTGQMLVQDNDSLSAEIGRLRQEYKRLSREVNRIQALCIKLQRALNIETSNTENEE